MARARESGSAFTNRVGTPAQYRRRPYTEKEDDMGEKIGIDLGMGWFPDYPDHRDFTADTDQLPQRLQQLDQQSIRDMVQRTGIAKATDLQLPKKHDLRQWCSPIENQGSLGSCTANAGVGLLEYYERRAFGNHLDGSRLFLYKATRDLLRWSGDKGAFLRTTMAAMALFGVPPETYWPYNINDFDKEPPAFCYAFAQNYQALQYFRLDSPNLAPKNLLRTIKTLIVAGLPSMFGFTVYSSIDQAGQGGKIPFPANGEQTLGGHAVVAVGFDDTMKITNQGGGVETTGALLIRNSWGPGWGEKGYGWLPYDYVLKSLAIDWWTLLKNEWVNTGNFQL